MEKALAKRRAFWRELRSGLAAMALGGGFLAVPLLGGPRIWPIHATIAFVGGFLQVVSVCVAGPSRRLLSGDNF